MKTPHAMQVKPVIQEKRPQSHKPDSVKQYLKYALIESRKFTPLLPNPLRQSRKIKLADLYIMEDFVVLWKIT